MIWVIIVSILLTAGIVAGLAIRELLIGKHDRWGGHRYIDIPKIRRVQYIILCIFIIVFCVTSLMALFIKSVRTESDQFENHSTTIVAARATVTGSQSGRS